MINLVNKVKVASSSVKSEEDGLAPSYRHATSKSLQEQPKHCRLTKKATPRARSPLLGIRDAISLLKLRPPSRDHGHLPEVLYIQ